MFLPTLSAAIEAAIQHAKSKGYTLAEDIDVAFASVIYGGVRYGETRRVSAELVTPRGNIAKKGLQLTVYRPSLNDPHAGEYETLFYIL